ncbi:MAG: chemotaxis protein CheB [Myxococcales bacterium]|nr:chemotaxis protein CheB [Myxococcales bacterium]
MVSKVQLVVIGTSMGGFRALESVLGGLSPDFPLAIAVVQHRGTDVAQSQLSRLLQLKCTLPVNECNDKEAIVGGRIYLAPSDYHLLVDEGRFALSVDERVYYARPSIDVLFESAADTYHQGVLGVLLTGASADGTRGAARIKQRGGTVLAQDPRTAESPVMPQAAISAGAVDHVLPLEEIGAYLNVASAVHR